MVHFSPDHAGSQLQAPVAVSQSPLRLQLTFVRHLKGVGGGGGGGGGGCGWCRDCTACNAAATTSNTNAKDGRIATPVFMEWGFLLSFLGAYV